MKELKTYASFDELSEQDQILLKAAIKSREQAYAPYSHFKVGASVLLDNGKVITGNNQENAAYPSGLCAERVAVFAAKANYPNAAIVAMAVSARNSNRKTNEPATCCGSCRQVMLEYELNQQSPIKIIFYGEEGNVWELPSTKLLLPLFFNRDFLD